MRYTPENTAHIDRPVRVYLDGVEIHDVHEADDVEGYVIVASRNADGNLYDDGYGNIATERRTGTVVVEAM